MTTLYAAGQPGAWARTALRLCAEFAGFAALLFVARFVARSHLVVQTDEMCHVGAIAVDVLAHGVRFPLLAYAPVEYNNGAFFSGLLTAVSFALFGQNVLALKLVTHAVSSMGAVAALYLLRGCLEELGLRRRWIRWTATTTLVIAIALAPTLLAAEALATVGFASPAEGSAVNTILLALFAWRHRRRSMPLTAALWMLVGFALYLSKGTALVIPVLGLAELAAAWRAPAQLVAAVLGFLVGQLPELPLLAERHVTGWSSIVTTIERNIQAFPRALFDSLMTFAEFRLGLIAAWALALGLGIALLIAALRRPTQRGTAAPAPPPFTLALIVGVAALHLAMLAMIAQGGLDHYVIYGYPTAAVLLALLAAWPCAAAADRWGGRAGIAVGVAAVALALLLHRPALWTWRPETVGQLWRDRASAACAWHLAEGFAREYQYGLAPAGQTRDQHTIERCRSLSEPALSLDCIGGIARERHVRAGVAVSDGVPRELSAAEGRAFAFYHGIHRAGDASACRDFADPVQVADCTAAVQLECLVFGRINTRLLTGYDLARPRCALPELPMDGYWSAQRAQLLTATDGTPPYLATVLADNLLACQWVFDACYER